MHAFSINFRTFLFLFSVLLSSCKKEDPPQGSGPEAPEITLTSPSSNAQYNKGEAISITGSVKDNQQVGVTIVKLKNLTDNSEVTLFEIHEHVAYPNAYSLSQSYTIPSTQASGNYRLIIQANDFDNNLSEKTVDLQIL